MPLLANSLHSRITRLFLAIMGLRLTHWYRQVEQLWAMNPERREQHLAQILAENSPTASDGSVIRSFSELSRAPILDKSMFRRLSSDVQQKQGLTHRHTSGTTGEPTHVWLDKHELGQMLGVREYCFRKHRVKVGDREARLWARPETGLRAKLKNWVLNREVFHPTGQDAVDEVRRLLASRPRYLYGYSSLILEAARIVELHQLEPPPLRCVVCTAETILPSQKRFIEEQFSAPVLEEYGCTEFDIVAFECRNGHRHIANPWLVIECDADEVLVTDVSRRTQSLVRYAIGDALQLSTSECSALGGPAVLSSIEGRSIERFAEVSSHEKFHATEFSKAVDSYNNCHRLHIDFQVRQSAMNTFEMDTVGLSLSNKAEFRSFIVDRIEQATCYRIGLQVNVLSESDCFRGSKRSYFIDERS